MCFGGWKSRNLLSARRECGLDRQSIRNGGEAGAKTRRCDGAGRFGGVRGKGLRAILLLPFNLLRACVQSARLLARIRPNIVLGMGGYISVPVGLMALARRCPLIIHEQNAIAGLANRLLAKI